MKCITLVKPECAQLNVKNVEEKVLQCATLVQNECRQRKKDSLRDTIWTNLAAIVMQSPCLRTYCTHG